MDGKKGACISVVGGPCLGAKDENGAGPGIDGWPGRREAVRDCEGKEGAGGLAWAGPQLCVLAGVALCLPLFPPQRKALDQARDTMPGPDLE